MFDRAEETYVQQEGQLELHPHFVTPIYVSHRPEFLDQTRKASLDSLNKVRKIKPIDDMYPSIMSESLIDSPYLKEFSEYIGQTSWGILNEQGFAMQDYRVLFSEMWAQEHHKYSSMEQHIHGLGAQIVGFYFMDVPENSSKVLFHDPRISRLQGGLPESNTPQVTIASSVINYDPKPGMVIFTNAWLAHAFSKHASTLPFRFIHFNIVAAPTGQVTAPEVEII